MMPRNERFVKQSGMTNMPILRQMVEEYGKDAAAEEAIVARLCKDYPPRVGLGWINTDHMRERIRKLQGRERRKI